jgi:hypothetical protein
MSAHNTTEEYTVPSKTKSLTDSIPLESLDPRSLIPASFTSPHAAASILLESTTRQILDTRTINRRENPFRNSTIKLQHRGPSLVDLSNVPSIGHMLHADGTTEGVAPQSPLG